MKTLNFTQEQITKILTEVANSEGGFNQVLQISLEAMMRAERQEHNITNSDVSNGFRSVRTFGQGNQLRLSVPRSRNSSFYPVLLGILRNQEEESKRIAFKLYGAGLTTQQVGEVFEDIYGDHYSTSQVSRMFDYAREEVKEWLNRGLDPYYPIIYIDATYISTRRVDAVSKEAYYTILGVKPDRTREVLAVVNFPTESASAWKEIFDDLKIRGVQKIDLVVCDGLSGIENAISSSFSSAHIQLCVVHLQRNVLKHIKPKDKSEIGEDLKEVFETGSKADNIDTAWERWINFIEKQCKKYPSLKNYATERYKLYFTFYRYDYRVRSMLYTTNWVERLNKDYKRTTKMRGALPNPDATILLLGYVAMTRTAYNRKIPKLDYEKLFEWED
jgi:putative transposase